MSSPAGRAGKEALAFWQARHFHRPRWAGYNGQNREIKELTMGVVATLRLLLIWGVAAFLATGGVQARALYTVDKLPLDASGASPSEARDKALAAGRDRAFGIIYKRLTQQVLWASQPKISPQELDEMVTAFTVDNERHSTTRYLANASFTFSPARVREKLQSLSLVFSETQAKPVVILPMKPGVGWANDTLWASSWASVAQRGSLRPVVVPMGDAAEIAMAGNVIADATNWSQLGPLAAKYSATEAWLTSAQRTANGLSISVVSLKPDGRSSSRFNVIANAGESEPQLMVRAAAMVRASFEEVWKSQTAVNYGMKSSLEAAVPFTGLPDWVAIRNELSGIRLIERVNVDQMLTQGARVRLDFVGKIDQLQATLRQAGMTLQETDNGLYILARSGADVTLLPPALLVPPAVPAAIANPLAIPSTGHSQPGVEGEAPPIAAPAPIPVP
jgi:hypothetical protein